MNIENTENLQQNINDGEIKQWMSEEYAKCASDPSYFIKNYCYIKHPTRGKIPFYMWPFQEQVLSEFRKYSKNIICKSRQLGISWLSSAYSVWLTQFHNDKNILVMATKEDVAKAIIEKYRYIYKYLPNWLKVNRIEDNKLSQTFDNNSKINAIATTETSGRSDSLSLLILDECGFIANFASIWTALQPTLSTGGDIIALSSPNGVGNWFYKTFTDTEQLKNSFNPIKLDWRVHPERDEKWRAQQDIDLGELQAKQEYDAEFIGTGNSIIDNKILEFYTKTYVTPPIEKLENDLLWIWEQPIPEKRYLISADVGRGDGTDYSAFHVIDIDTFEQIAEYEAKISTTEYAELLYRVGVMYNTANVVVENASIGWAVVQHLININYPNIYYSETNLKYVDEYTAKDLQNKLIDYNKKKQLVPGWTTSSSTRPLIINKIMESLRKQEFIVRSERTITQLQTFVWHNNKAEAMDGYNDDIIMALCIGLYVRDVVLQLNSSTVELIKKTLSSFTCITPVSTVNSNVVNKNFIVGSGNNKIDIRQFY